jgi:hypothetical protein
VLTESSAGPALHFLVGILGILIMSAVAWLNGWYKRTDGKIRIGINADIAGGGG